MIQQGEYLWKLDGSIDPDTKEQVASTHLLVIYSMQQGCPGPEILYLYLYSTVHDPKVCHAKEFHFFLFCFIIVQKYLLGKCSQSVPLFQPLS